MIARLFLYLRVSGTIIHALAMAFVFDEDHIFVNHMVMDFSFEVAVPEFLA